MTKESKELKAKLLLVEDHRNVSDPIKKFFEKKNWEVEIIEYAHIAIQKIEDNRWDAVLTDMQLRGKDNRITDDDVDGGVRVAIKANETSIPVLIFSSFLEKEDKRREDLLQNGIAEDKILIKPVSSSTLYEKIQDIIKLGK